MNLRKFYRKHYAFILSQISKMVYDKKSINPEDILQNFIISKIKSGQIQEIIEKTTETNRGFLVQSIRYFVIDELRKINTKKNQLHKTEEMKEELLTQKTLLCNNHERCMQKIQDLRKNIKGSKVREAVFELWYEGFGNPEIAEKLEITTRQVEQHKYRIRQIAKSMG